MFEINRGKQEAWGEREVGKEDVGRREEAWEGLAPIRASERETAQFRALCCRNGESKPGVEQVTR